MSGVHGPARRRFGLRWTAAATALVIGGAAALSLSTAAHAATAPTPNYNPSGDTATFTVTGVEDSNCLVSTGGTEIWIKPGDPIKFTSALAGINLSGLGLTTSLVAGLNVTAKIDAGNSPQAAQMVSVAGGKTTVFPSATQKALSPGDHTITWTANSLALLPTLLGPAGTLPLTSSALQSGASLSWSGVIHVTSSAPQCKIAVSTPTVGVSVGPVKVTVPPVTVTVPVTLPTGLPSLGGIIPGTGKGSSAPAGGTSTSKTPSVTYTPPGLSVAQQVMPYTGTGGGSGLFFGGALPDTTSTAPLGSALPDTGSGAPAAAPSTGSSSATAAAPANTKTIGLASNRATGAQMPVLLAIIAIIALSLVTATYARLFLLRRNSV